MAGVLVGNWVELNVLDDSLEDVYGAAGLSGISFKGMLISASAAGAIIFETDRGADATMGTVQVVAGMQYIPGPLNFPDGLKIGATPPADLSIILFT